MRSVAVAGLCAVALLAAACSSSGPSAQGPTTTTTAAAAPAAGPTTTTVSTRPSGPAAAIGPELTGGSGPFMAAGTNESLAGTGYVQHEYVASGTATAYRSTGALSGDGRWTFAPTTKAAYRTRILVRRPAKPSAFSGTVVVEWLNVSGGLDTDPEWASLKEELIRQGDIWVGVSAQQIGVLGGPVLVSVPVAQAKGLAGAGLKKIDPARYSSLVHPGDGYSFDMFTQVARAMRLGGAAMGGSVPKAVIAAGESQSAFALVTYVDGVQPLTHEFDGFFVHSRGAIGLPLVGPGKSADIAGAISGTPVIFRTDQAVPVLDLQSESDVTGLLDSVAARQPDSNSFRLWEVAGTSHVDLHLLGPLVAGQLQCGAPINDGPMHVVAKAAFHALDVWVRTGVRPPIAPRLAVTNGPKPTIRRNSDGIALGGIRTPVVDVPVAVVSGVPGPSTSLICLLLGSTKPLSAARLAQRYPSRAAYVQRFDADADQAIAAGFVLAADRPALLAFAQPQLVSG
jgi:hypothetical protein